MEAVEVPAEVPAVVSDGTEAELDSADVGTGVITTVCSDVPAVFFRSCIFLMRITQVITDSTQIVRQSTTIILL